MKGSEKITIIDVARLAGVSKGTVDRVVHGRGDVSKKSEEKVRKAIQELGYHPNLYASMLATRRERSIALLMPRSSSGDYWEKVLSGISEVEDEMATFGIGIRTFLYDQFDSVSFMDACQAVLDSKPSGVVFPPLFRNDALNFAIRLKQAGIPYVFVDTKIEDDSYFAYFGMPKYKSGYLCAYLLTEHCGREDVGSVAVVRIMRDKKGQSDPTALRREGFVDYISGNFPECRILNVFINPENTSENISILEDFFREHPDVRHLVMLNSRIYLLRDYLVSHPDPCRRVIGFDSLEKNVALLRDGHVEKLISHHAEEQPSRAVRMLAASILRDYRPETKDNYMQMNILTRYNCD